MTPKEKQAYLEKYRISVLVLRQLDMPKDHTQEMIIAASPRLRAREEAERKEAERVKEACERAIAAVHSDLLRKALELRFLEGLTWEHIADELGYSVPSVYRIRRAALAAVQV